MDDSPRQTIRKEFFSFCFRNRLGFSSGRSGTDGGKYFTRYFLLIWSSSTPPMVVGMTKGVWRLGQNQRRENSARTRTQMTKSDGTAANSILFLRESIPDLSVSKQEKCRERCANVQPEISQYFKESIVRLSSESLQVTLKSGGN